MISNKPRVSKILKTKILSKTHKQDVLMCSLQKFYKKPENIKKLLTIIQNSTNSSKSSKKQINSKNMINDVKQAPKISLRVIDWFVTNYSKKYNTNYIISEVNDDGMISNKQLIVYIDYKLQLKGYSKKQFDPFCRRERIEFYYNKTEFITTTVGQLNFFRWAIENNVMNYIEQNLEKIEKDMNNSYKAVYNLGKKTQNKTRRKRQELSVSATRTVNKHNVKIVVSFN